MKTKTSGNTLLITDLDRLTSTNANYFKELALAVLEDEHHVLDVDMSQARYLDSEGLGALIAVKKRLEARKGKIRLLQPIPFVRQMLQLLRMDRLFQIV